MLTGAPQRSESIAFKGSSRTPCNAALVPLQRSASRFSNTTPAIKLEETSTSLEVSVEVSPKEAVRRLRLNCNGLIVESIRSVEAKPFEIRFKAQAHLLVFSEQDVRSEGETHVEGLPTSTLRDLSQKLTLVPAGHEYRDRQMPRGTVRIVCIYIDPAALSKMGSVELGPRLFFKNAALLETVAKLSALAERLESRRHYLEALGSVLMHEILRLEDAPETTGSTTKGGLAAWQERTALTYIDKHLDETITLETLAGLVRLSPFHFCRVFKQTFGVPPHRFHMLRRIEKAKELLAEPNPSVTQIGLQLGFSETSSFTAAFRKATGLTPTAYHRSLIF